MADTFEPKIIVFCQLPPLVYKPGPEMHTVPESFQPENEVAV